MGSGIQYSNTGVQTAMINLIDGDIVNYRVGWTTNEEPEWIARARARDMVEGILHDTGATEFQIWLSDSAENNFRYKLWHGYKANRKDTPRPKHYDYIKEYLIGEWDARIAYGREADDALGINQVKSLDVLEPDRTCIASIDKDLEQISGLNYNFVKKEWKTITVEEANRSFYTSILVGDVTDNIKGCRGIGPVKASKALAGCITPDEYITRIIEVYKKQEDSKSTEEILEHILLAGRLLKILQEEGEPLWQHPFLLSEQKVEHS